MYNYIQWIIVGAALIGCAAYVIVKIIKYARSKNAPCNCGCSSCPAAKHCHEKSDK